MREAARGIGFMRALLWLLAAIASIGLGASFFVESSFAGRVVEVQPIERDPAAETGWRLAGETFPILDAPAEVFVTHGGPGIPPQVDVARLRGNPRVVPYEPIRSTIQTARWGALIALGLILLGMAALKRLIIVVPDDA